MHVEILRDYWLWKEVQAKLELSNPAYKYWKHTPHIKLNNKYIFIKKTTLPEKHCHIEEKLTDLTGFVPVQYAADRLHISAHIFRTKNMKLFDAFEYIYVEKIKFVNLAKFFAEYHIQDYRESILHMGLLEGLDTEAATNVITLKEGYGLAFY